MDERAEVMRKAAVYERAARVRADRELLLFAALRTLAGPPAPPREDDPPAQGLTHSARAG